MEQFLKFIAVIFLLPFAMYFWPVIITAMLVIKFVDKDNYLAALGAFFLGFSASMPYILFMNQLIVTYIGQLK